MSNYPNPEPQTETDTVIERSDFIESMRTVANSVSVVTTDGDAGRHGATVSAFCSVSADPPTVLVCLKADSRIARLAKANGGFALNVLGHTQSPLAVRFAGGEDASLKAVQQLPDSACDRFDGVELDTRYTQPVLQGALAFCCRVTQAHTAGSHTVCVAEVVDHASGGQIPLVYHDGDFHGLGPLPGAR